MLKQFHYLTWPDHGVPSEVAHFVLFCRHIRLNISRMPGPLLVHCRLVAAVIPSDR